MGAEDQDVAKGAIVWFANISSSVVLIFVTKALMQFYLFQYPTTISGLHFLGCAITLGIARQLGWGEAGNAIPGRHTLLYTLVGSISIATANISLSWNSLDVYQLAKLLLAPMVCGLEVHLIGRRFTFAHMVCIGIVLTGVGIITVTDVTIHASGLVMAAVFVASTSLQQVLCGRLQAMHKLTPDQLLAYTAPVQGSLLLLLGPFVDKLATGKWVTQWEVNVPGIEMLALSCVVAVAVNLSQFILLGRFTATSFQVLGHAKTLLVLLGGWMLFNEVMGLKELGGIGIAVAGMVAYGFVTLTQPVGTGSITPTIRAPFMPPGGSGTPGSLEAGGSEGPSTPTASGK